MANKKGTGMLAVWCEVPENLENEFNRWYNEEHVFERLSVPGVLNAARYEAVLNGPKHLAIYELESIGVLESSEYKHFLSNPTKWTQKMSPDVIGKTYIRNVYDLIFPNPLETSALVSPLADALQVGRMNIPKQYETEWNNWYNTIYVPNYETVPGVIMGRRFKAVEGEPDYMTFYELDSPEVSQTEEWFSQQTAHPSYASMREAMEHISGSPGIWVKTFDPS